MNDQIHNENLLRDILAEEAPAEFRTTLRNQTLRLARRRRHVRQARLAVLPVTLVVVIFLSWHRLVPTGQQGHSQEYLLVRTEPMVHGILLETRPLKNESMVISTETSNLFTTAETAYRAKQIDDEELLELAAPNPVVLIRHGPNQAELLIAGLAVGKE